MAVTVVVLAPSPLLTVTIEDRAGEPDIRVHAGGQGVWQARMLVSLGVRVVLCAGLGGETGEVLEHLLPTEGLTLARIRTGARNGGYVHDRRTGERVAVAEAPGGPLDRHEHDELYELALTEGLEHGMALLSGPHDDRVVPASLYRRLTTDLVANGCSVAVDLAGERLTAALVDDQILAVHLPELEPTEPKGAGDSMTAGMLATLARGEPAADALRTGAACGALNVVRRGLGTGNADAVAAIAERVQLVRCDDRGREQS